MKNLSDSSNVSWIVLNRTLLKVSSKIDILDGKSYKSRVRRLKFVVVIVYTI